MFLGGSPLPIAGMVARLALIPTSIVACEAGHFLLLALEVHAVHVLQKPHCLFAPQSRRMLGAMFNINLTIFRAPESETQIAHHVTPVWPVGA